MPNFVLATVFIFIFWASGPFVASFEFGPRTLSVFIRFFESLSLFVLNSILCKFLFHTHLLNCVLSYLCFAFSNVMLNVILHCVVSYLIAFRILNIFIFGPRAHLWRVSSWASNFVPFYSFYRVFESFRIK